jgi:hypothetical protein
MFAFRQRAASLLLRALALCRVQTEAPMAIRSCPSFISLGAALGSCAALQLCGTQVLAGSMGVARVVQVSGSGVDLLSGMIVHSETKTSSGSIQKSTEIVELDGVLRGRVLVAAKTTIDSAKGTLTNTGARSEPVMIHDSRFHFGVNLATGADSGVVYLSDHIAGPKVNCTLYVTGKGKDSAGNPIFDCRGDCTFAG